MRLLTRAVLSLIGLTVPSIVSGQGNGGGASCGLLSTTKVLLYSDISNGADAQWFTNMLAWWSAADSTLTYQALPASSISPCNLASFTGLRIFIHPGGNSYDSLSALGATGVAAVRAYVQRDQSNPSSYVGACAGAYSSGHDYIWETMYEGTSYYNFATSPPYSFFPHTTEGSIVDIADAQFGSYETNGNKHWLQASMSNGHKMIYWGGPTFGWNGLPNYAATDSNVNVILYYQDVYGYNDMNLPAAWTTKLPNFARASVLSTSIHAEADATPTVIGALTTDQINANRRWLAHWINQVAATTFTLPTVNVQPSLSTTAPHTTYPTLPCTVGKTNLLFCDNFAKINGNYPGMFQWQRNQTLYNQARPWNVTFTGTMMGQSNGYYGTGVDGAADGWAFSIPNQGTLAPPATITSQVFSTVSKNTVTLQYKYRGKTLSGGLFQVQYTTNGGSTWTNLFSGNMYPAVTSWTSKSYALPTGQPTVQIAFKCVSGAAVTNFCGVDDVYVSYT